ncbi:MAG: response regulator, partial [Cyanobacteria bacterium REEB65]|nr:response regulator [Cyanobacteria bacterium REEB65]
MLIVEDEGIVALGIRQSLEGLGYDVVGSAATGEAAIQLARSARPDLVLMDIMLPGQMDGIAAADAIRNEFDLPVIFLTAYSDKQTLERAKATEPYGYVVKPFDPHELQIAIEVAAVRHASHMRIRAAERRARRSEAQCHALIEASPDAML